MKSMFRKTAAATLVGLLALAGGAQAQDKPREVLTGGHSVAAPRENRIYVMDSVFNHLTESRVHVYDVTNGKFLGLVPTSFNGHVQLSNDGRKIYTMTTYHERVTRGKRTDVVEVWDADKLTFDKEIIVPPKRVQGLNYDGMFRQTTDGRFIVLQNASPATSIGVVDVAKGDYVQEITAAAGCWSVIPQPNRPRSFMTICGDGALLTINLGEDGKVASQSRSKPMFSTKDDPIFIAPALQKDKVSFVSFYGNVYTADFSGEELKLEEPWSLLTDEDRAKGWVPGGYNLTGMHQASGRLYVLMHPDGKEGTHKFPAAEIWVMDTRTRKRVARIPGRDALSMSIDQKANRLLTLDGGNVHVYDISQPEPKHLRTIENAAEASLQVQPHPSGGA
ncbi:MAG: amine dehydrogenase large subunit [Alcaligenes sp.]